jgi:predicted amidohydrolase YtcJ
MISRSISSSNIFTLLSLFVLLLSCKADYDQNQTVDTLIFNAKVWTGNSVVPDASWIAISNDRIAAVGSSTIDMPKAKKQINAQGQLIVPGFNDSHVHFAAAGHLLMNINLLDVSDQHSFISRVKETVDRLPSGSWILRGDWGAYEAWNMGSAGGDTRKAEFLPHKDMIDSISPNHPVLVTKYDRSVGLANAAALSYLNINSETGILRGDLLRDALRLVPDKAFELRVAESERALEELRKWGITTVQDMSPPDQLDVYEHIRKNGKLTARINFSPSRLIEYEVMAKKGWIIKEVDGILQPSGDEWISFGTLKSHIDGIMGARTARFFEPYSDNDYENRAWRGGWREFSNNLINFKNLIGKADNENIQLRIHAIGDQANSILLDILDSLELNNGPKDRRFRLVHAQVIAPGDFDRLKGRGVVAEVQPYHVTDDMRWMEERIGFERCKGAYAFKTLQDMGCILSFGSDWPGTNASYYTVNPYYTIYAAVTRQTLFGEPSEGWFPEQRLSLTDALKAYTYGSAYGAFEDHIKGTITPGKLADLVILDTNLFETAPDEWLKGEIALTMVGGEIVYQKD